MLMLQGLLLQQQGMKTAQLKEHENHIKGTKARQHEMKKGKQKEGEELEEEEEHQWFRQFFIFISCI
jgi:hypothetical protein